ncbi:YciY family protein [Samsonia erythrinae]|uniref:YciY family protein n=1 Tax=Samsonia erythrinae TaxID=160434 RepID=UPI0010468267|nr:YciY family protein [Samsonia erythrinae]
MKRSRNEVSRWRMLRQVQRRRSRWLEAQSRTYCRIHCARYLRQQHQRRALLYAVACEW